MAVTQGATAITFNDATTQSTGSNFIKYSTGSFTGTSVTLLSSVTYSSYKAFYIYIAFSQGVSVTQNISASSSPSFQAQYLEASNYSGQFWNGNGTSTTGGYVGFAYTNSSGGNMPGLFGTVRILCPTYNANAGLSLNVIHDYCTNSSIAAFGATVVNRAHTRPMTGLGQGASQTFTYGFSFSASCTGTYDIYAVPA
jgi:hypothetical protein